MAYCKASECTCRSQVTWQNQSPKRGRRVEREVKLQRRPNVFVRVFNLERSFDGFWGEEKRGVFCLCWQEYSWFPLNCQCLRYHPQRLPSSPEPPVIPVRASGKPHGWQRKWFAFTWSADVVVVCRGFPPILQGPFSQVFSGFTAMQQQTWML